MDHTIPHHTITYITRFNGDFPGEAGLANSTLVSSSTAIHYMSDLKHLGKVLKCYVQPLLVGLRLCMLQCQGPKTGQRLLFVCSYHFGSAEFVLTVLPLSCLNLETLLTLLDRGRFVVVHPHSTLHLPH